MKLKFIRSDICRIGECEVTEELLQKAKDAGIDVTDFDALVKWVIEYDGGKGEVINLQDSDRPDEKWKSIDLSITTSAKWLAIMHDILLKGRKHD